MFCTNCGTANEPGAQFCVNCGTTLPAGVQPAGQPSTASTGEAVPPTSGPSTPNPSQFGTPPPYAGGAPNYGQPTRLDPTAKSKLAAGLLGIFLGAFGIHRFYLGYKNIAIAQLACGVIGLLLLPFTCGLIYLGAHIWGLVDGIMILTGSLATDGEGKPLRD